MSSVLATNQRSTMNALYQLVSPYPVWRSIIDADRYECSVGTLCCFKKTVEFACLTKVLDRARLQKSIDVIWEGRFVD